MREFENRLLRTLLKNGKEEINGRVKKCSSSQILRLLWDLNIGYCIHQIPLHVSVLG
jgi:hypothetical protein